MFYEEEIKLNDAAELLEACGLSKPRCVDYTAGVFFVGENENRLVAAASLKGDMIQGVAVDPSFQGEDLTAKVLTHIIGVARRSGLKTLYLFTKAEKAMQFMGLGFKLVAKARPYAALLEWGESGIEQYTDKLKALCADAVKKTDEDKVCQKGLGALVMNCNPFTRGHRYLIEYAAKRKAHVFVMAVEEDISLFPFADRLEMIRLGVSDLDNVTVIAGGRYAVSTLTFPSYFTREENLAKAHAAMDSEIFASKIAPALAVDERFVGTEPFSEVTAVYNETLKERLPRYNIKVTEIHRFEYEDKAVSASEVRAVLREVWEQNGSLRSSNAIKMIKSRLYGLLPDSTMNYICRGEMLETLDLAFSKKKEAGDE